MSEIREGLLCPVCLRDLGTVSLLQDHFEEEHAQDKDVLYQLKGLFDKAKKKILKKEREESDFGLSSIQQTSNISQKPSTRAEYSLVEWEPQDLGVTRSSTDYFKQERGKRIDRCVIETNKLLIRLDKLLGPDVPTDPGKRKENESDSTTSRGLVTTALCKAKNLTTLPEGLAKMARNMLYETRVEYDMDDTPFERAVVPWTLDSTVEECGDCGRRFTLTRRRHHCRLCGGIMCSRCSQFLPHDYARKLTNPAFQYEGRGFSRSSSNSSLNSLFGAEGEEHVRTCGRCRTLLERRDQQIEQRNSKPIVVQLYERMKHAIAETDRLLKHFLKMSDSIRSGESTYGLEDANTLRTKIMKLYENIDSISKHIMKLGTEAGGPEGGPSVQEVQLQNRIRMYARGYLQDNLMGLRALPTAEEFAKLKDQRKEQMLARIEAEKQAVAERGRLARLRELREERPETPPSLTSTAQSARPADLRTHKRAGSAGVMQDTGWRPTEVTHGATDDPMVQQMNIIRGYIKQAKQADRWDEVHIFKANLKELQQAYWLEKEKEQRSTLQSPLQQPSFQVSTHTRSQSITPTTSKAMTQPAAQSYNQTRSQPAFQYSTSAVSSTQGQTTLQRTPQNSTQNQSQQNFKTQSETSAQGYSSLPASSVQNPMPVKSSSQSRPMPSKGDGVTPGVNNKISIASVQSKQAKPATLNPFDDDYDETQASAYLTKKN